MKKNANQLWIQEEDNRYTIGITEELQDDAGEIGFVSLAPLGEVQVGDTLVELEASKAVIEVPSPLTGRIVQRHDLVEDQPDLLDSKDPKQNWILILDQVDPEDFQDLD